MPIICYRLTRRDNSEVLGMYHPRWCRGEAGGNPGNAENPESQDTCINMPISTHSSAPNLLDSSAHHSKPNQTPTEGRDKGTSSVSDTTEETTAVLPEAWRAHKLMN